MNPIGVSRIDAGADSRGQYSLFVSGPRGKTIGMKEVAKLLNDMVGMGVIANYAVFGAVAQMRYTEAVSTLDADVLIALPSDDGLVSLDAIYRFCASRGYIPEGEAIRVGDWPVQFIPAFNALTEEAMRIAEQGDIEGIPLRVVRADYLAVIAVSVGRAKDMARILALLESGATHPDEVEALAAAHGLKESWKSFKKRFLDA